MTLTPKQRAIEALNLRVPDEVPTFELEFQLEEEMFGRKFITNDLQYNNICRLTRKEKEEKIYSLAEYMAHVYTELEYCIIPAYGPCDWGALWERGEVSEELALLFKYLKEMMGQLALLGFHGDGTFAIPDGNGMYEFAYRTVDDPDGLKEEAHTAMTKAIERNKRLKEAGIDVAFLCSDYCYNTGPFLSPDMFAEFIQPYLAKLIEENTKAGLYSIKHTDGNIMPIIEQLVEAKPHALHSIDPMAGVDIKEVKEKYGDKVCLVGNVHCAALQTGTDDEVRASAEYCLTHGKKDGGYIFSTSNVPFKGMPPERYSMMLDIWRQKRKY